MSVGPHPKRLAMRTSSILLTAAPPLQSLESIDNDSKYSSGQAEADRNSASDQVRHAGPSVSCTTATLLA